MLVRQLIILGGGFRHMMLTEQVTTALLGSKTSDRCVMSGSQRSFMILIDAGVLDSTLLCWALCRRSV